jgi:hypothetical protein
LRLRNISAAIAITRITTTTAAARRIVEPLPLLLDDVETRVDEDVDVCGIRLLLLETTADWLEEDWLKLLLDDELTLLTCVVLVWIVDEDCELVEDDALEDAGVSVAHAVMFHPILA